MFLRAVLVALVAVLATVVNRPCLVADRVGDQEFCKDLMAGGACGMFPTVSSLACGKTCGFCPRRDPAKPLNWKQIDRVHWSNLSYASFLEHYKEKATPVIIEGWLDEHPKMAAWSLERMATECGDAPVHCVQRRAAALEMIMGMVASSARGTQVLDYYLTWRFGTTLAKELERARTKVDLKSFVAHTLSKKVSGVAFQSLFDYAASSVTVNDFPAAELCLPLAEDLALPEWGTRETLVFSDQAGEDRRVIPNVFIEADGGRAYPAHQHGRDLSHNFQVMVQGGKRVVFWPFRDRAHLYPTTVTTENQEEIFLAEGVHRRFDLFPAMAEAEALEATLATGDLMYIPCKGIHVFESVGPSLGIRFAHHDALSGACGRELQEAGSTSQMPDYVDYVHSLQSVKTPEGRKPPATLPELLADIARTGHGVSDDAVRKVRAHGGDGGGGEELNARDQAQKRHGLTRHAEDAPKEQEEEDRQVKSSQELLSGRT
jgi:hypothetical protein